MKRHHRAASAVVALALLAGCEGGSPTETMHAALFVHAAVEVCEESGGIIEVSTVENDVWGVAYGRVSCRFSDDYQPERTP